MVKIFNSLSRQKEVFKPLIPGKVNMYVCGVTVYDHSHIGHARSAVVFDMIARYLRFRGYDVKLVKNFTDIDDKIIKRSNEDKIFWKDLTEKYIQEYHREMSLLNVLTPAVEPKATEYLPEMIKVLQGLMDKGFAYAKEGDVYFRVGAFASYGKLSGRDLSGEDSRARVEANELKEHPLDFVLWKASKPGEPSWDSPWGKGRPGWHIECSAMAMNLLGETLDIHGGGEDLLFPHHENEIAQSEGFSGKPFVRYWVHNGFVTVNQEKMSKSLGNFFTIREVFQKIAWPEAVTGEALRYFILSTYYRQPVQFSDQAIDEAKNSLDRFYILFQKCEQASGSRKEAGDKLSQILDKTRQAFIEAMDDDFNTPEAIAQLHLLRNELNREFSGGLSSREGAGVLAFFKELGEPLGLFKIPEKEWKFSRVMEEISNEDVERFIHERQAARKAKDWKRSDEIRKELAEKGVILEDRPDGGTSWRK
ncbi:MAG: cysteine--tRNA ligase [Nitrospirae bacterium]|nr:cysteine--tRNA ligase [Nitrospirota bacterium]